jgi:hypothetical protein
MHCALPSCKATLATCLPGNESGHVVAGDLLQLAGGGGSFAGFMLNCSDTG